MAAAWVAALNGCLDGCMAGWLAACTWIVSPAAYATLPTSPPSPSPAPSVAARNWQLGGRRRHSLSEAALSAFVSLSVFLPHQSHFNDRYRGRRWREGRPRGCVSHSASRLRGARRGSSRSRAAFWGHPSASVSQSVSVAAYSASDSVSSRHPHPCRRPRRPRPRR